MPCISKIIGERKKKDIWNINISSIELYMALKKGPKKILLLKLRNNLLACLNITRAKIKEANLNA